METRLEKLKKKMDKMAAQMRVIETRERNQKRKTETRRKILLGALTEHRMLEDVAFRDDIHRRLESFLTRTVDRAAFNLDPIDS